MINSEQIKNLTLECFDTFENKDDLFLVDIRVLPGNIIQVFIDSDKSIDISDCIKVSRYIESKLDRETEDFELNVSSYGLDQSIFMPRQFKKFINKTFRFVLNNNEDFNANIKAVDTEKLFVATIPKRKKDISEEKTILISEINKAKLIITF